MSIWISTLWYVNIIDVGIDSEYHSGVYSHSPTKNTEGHGSIKNINI